MTGERDLNKLLKTLSPVLRQENYVFSVLPDGRYGDLLHARPLASITEDEGLTLVLTQENADREGLTYTGTFRCISLKVHSSLEAVGLTAAVSALLAERGISANMLAGYYHDHILVPTAMAQEALAALKDLSR